MKKLFIILTTIALSTYFVHPSYAATAAPTGSATTGKLDAQINELKEKIASRVSELNLVEKRGMIGTVVEVKGNQITMTDNDNNTRYTDVDEITKFSSAGTKNFGLSDLTKGTKVSVLGIYNKQSKRILARFINTYTSPTFYTGTITSLDLKNYQFSMTTTDQKEIKVDVDTASKVSSYNPTDGLARYGFSKLAVGDRVRVVGNQNKKDPTLFSSLRIVDYLTISKDPNAPVATTVPSPTTGEPSAAPTAAGKKSIKPIQ